MLRCSSQLFSIFPSFEPSCWPMWVIFLITTDHHQNSQTYKNHRLVFCWKSWQHCAVGGGGAYSDAVLPPKRRLHLFAVNLVKVKVIKYSFLHLLLDLSRRCKALPGTTYVAIHKGQTVRIEHKCISWLTLNSSSNVEGENCITRPSPPLNRSADFLC